MQDAASERPIMDRTAMYKAGKVGADLLTLPVDFVPEEGTNRAELGLDGLVVVFGGIDARHEWGRAQLMAREMNGDAGHARGALARGERGGRAYARQGQCDSPVFFQPDHFVPPVGLVLATGSLHRNL